MPAEIVEWVRGFKPHLDEGACRTAYQAYCVNRARGRSHLASLWFCDLI